MKNVGPIPGMVGTLLGGPMVGGLIGSLTNMPTKPKPPLPMPDPEDQARARKKVLTDAAARSGRESTILSTTLG